MIAIQKNNSLLASIDLFSTVPAEQQELLDNSHIGSDLAENTR
jgi:hypothetical protein